MDPDIRLGGHDHPLEDLEICDSNYASQIQLCSMIGSVSKGSWLLGEC